MHVENGNFISILLLLLFYYYYWMHACLSMHVYTQHVHDLCSCLRVSNFFFDLLIAVSCVRTNLLRQRWTKAFAQLPSEAERKGPRRVHLRVARIVSDPTLRNNLVVVYALRTWSQLPPPGIHNLEKVVGKIPLIFASRCGSILLM